MGSISGISGGQVNFHKENQVWVFLVHKEEFVFLSGASSKLLIK